MSDVNDLDIELNKALDDLVPADEKPAEPAADPYEEFKREMRLKPGRWYVIHSYAGYEKKVKANIASRAENMQVDGIYERAVIIARPAAELPEPSADAAAAKADDTSGDGLRRAWDWLIQPK